MVLPPPPREPSTRSSVNTPDKDSHPPSSLLLVCTTSIPPQYSPRHIRLACITSALPHSNPSPFLPACIDWCLCRWNYELTPVPFSRFPLPFLLPGAVTSCIYFLIEVKGHPPANLAEEMAKAPWWAWTGGVLGAIFVLINILAIPKLGAGTTTAIIVCSQLVFSCIIDNFHLFGIKERQYTVWRGLATVGLIGSVGVIAKF